MVGGLSVCVIHFFVQILIWFTQEPSDTTKSFASIVCLNLFQNLSLSLPLGLCLCLSVCLSLSLSLYIYIYIYVNVFMSIYNGWLVVFYIISTLVGCLMPHPVYTYILNIHDF